MDDHGPLNGTRVVDIGHWVAGPFATQILSNLGATVIKVEPLSGESMAKSLPAAYAVANRGKMNLATDLSTPGGREVLKRLIRWADVVSHNLRPGVADRLGFGTMHVREINPRAVLLECAAYESSGLLSSEPGFDPVFWAPSGHAVRAAEKTGDPSCDTRLGAIDTGAGMLGAFAAASALYAARRTGQGRRIGVDLMGSSSHLISEVTRSPGGTLAGPAQLIGDRAGIHATESIYRLKDGWVAVIAPSHESRRRLATTLGLTSLEPQDAEFWEHLEHDQVAAVLANWSTSELIAALEPDVWVIPCHPDRRDQILHDDDLADDGIVIRSDDRSSHFLGFPVQFDRNRSHNDSIRVPETGEDSRWVLRQLGYTADEITAFERMGAVGFA